MALPLGKFLRVPVVLDVSFILAWVILLFSSGPATAFAWFGIGIATLFHEFGHVAAAKALRVPVTKVTVNSLGGFFEGQVFFLKPFQELVIFAAGPLANLVIACLVLSIHWLASLDGWLGLTLLYFAVMNLGMGTANLLPVYPLDGGHLLRALIYSKWRDYLSSTVFAVRSGQALAIAFAIVAACLSQIWVAAVLFGLAVFAQFQIGDTRKTLAIRGVVEKAAQRLGVPNPWTLDPVSAESDEVVRTILADPQAAAELQDIAGAANATEDARKAPGANEGKLPPFLRSA